MPDAKPDGCELQRELTPEEIAHHEAGHILAGQWLGSLTKGLNLNMEDPSDYRRACVLPDVQAFHLRFPNPADRLRAELLMYACGGAAAALLDPRLATVGTRGDEQLMQSAAKRLLGEVANDEDIARELELAMTRARKLMRNRANMVPVVAEWILSVYQFIGSLGRSASPNPLDEIDAMPS